MLRSPRTTGATTTADAGTTTTAMAALAKATAAQTANHAGANRSAAEVGAAVPGMHHRAAGLREGVILRQGTEDHAGVR